MKINKTNILSLILGFATTSSFAESIVGCDFTKAKYKNIERVVISTGQPGDVLIQYSEANGSEELAPVEGVGGTFGEIQFAAEIKHQNDAQRNTYVKVESKQLGLVQISYICNEPNSILCDTRGGGDSKFARATFNIAGDILKFDGSSLPLCRRIVIR